MTSFYNKLKNRIIIKENIASVNEEEKWIEKYKIYAEIIPINELNLKKIEGIDFGNILELKYKIFRIRFINKFLKIGRIAFKETSYSICRIINERDESRFLIIIAEEI